MRRQREGLTVLVLTGAGIRGLSYPREKRCPTVCHSERVEHTTDTIGLSQQRVSRHMHREMLHWCCALEWTLDGQRQHISRRGFACDPFSMTGSSSLWLFLGSRSTSMLDQHRQSIVTKGGNQ